MTENRASDKFIRRRAIEEPGENKEPSEPQWLDYWRNEDAYVLLAEPGGGKTSAFKTERDANGGKYVTARDFVTRDVERFRAVQPLYIDGLDEMRAGSHSFRQPLDDIRSRLDELGRPRFRLSCRQADWRTSVDRNPLAEVTPRGTLTVLHLTDLEESDIREMLLRLEVPDPDVFLEKAQEHGIRSLFGNPLLLTMVVRAIGSEHAKWPRSRTAILDEACKQLAREHNPEHLAESQKTRRVQTIIDDAGGLSALYLLSGVPGFALDATSVGSALVRLDALPGDLPVVDPRSAVASNLFVNDGDARIPLHRSIAEFLAGRLLADLVDRRCLPIRRVLSLMSGADGGIVEPLRGLYAWLTTHCCVERRYLVERDPLSVVLYGDVVDFSIEEKTALLAALGREAHRFPWFRKGRWESRPFGALGSPGMAPHLRDVLHSPDRSEAHQALIECVLDAVANTPSKLGLASDLESVVRDATFMPRVRGAALTSWLHQEPGGRRFLALLDDIDSGLVTDIDDHLAGTLLEHLYPEVIGPDEVLRYWHPLKQESLYGRYQAFWRVSLLKKTPVGSFLALMNAWIDRWPSQSDKSARFSRSDLAADLLAAALEESGESVPIETLYRWTGAVLSEHGSSRVSPRRIQAARQWLSERPSLVKDIVAYGWSRQLADTPDGQYRFWRAEGHALGAARPAEWDDWLLEQARKTKNEGLAHYCFLQAARSALRENGTQAFERVANWVEVHLTQWPAAREWQEGEWTCKLDDWQAEEAIRQKKDAEEESRDREERRRFWLQKLPSLRDGTTPPGVLNQIALASQGHFYDVQGDSPRERVEKLLGAGSQEAEVALAAVAAALQRPDLPTIEEILALDLQNKMHMFSGVCLLGASLEFERDPQVVSTWSDALAGRLAAFWLTGIPGDDAEWFDVLAESRAAVVAPVMASVAIQRLKAKGIVNVPGVWQLEKEDRFSELARLVVPEVIEAFPKRAKEQHLRVLNGELIPAAKRHLSRDVFAKIIATRLSLKSLDVPQRISFLAAGLEVDGERYIASLKKLVGTSQARTAHLGRAVSWQDRRQVSLRGASPKVLGALIELMGPSTSTVWPTGVHSVTPADERRDLVYDMVKQLSENPSGEASDEISSLVRHPKLERWRPTFERAVFDQANAKRSESFQYASVEETTSVLANKAPANSQDVAALCLDRLKNLEKHFRGDDTNRLDLFYKDDRKTPRTELACRDVLLPPLRDALGSFDINVHKEAQAAASTRADLRAERGSGATRIAVPVEIKKDDSRDLWSAWRTQLRTYVMDPDSDGVGIYLVLWFGQRRRSAPDGWRPASPEELHRALTDLIDPSLRHQLHVVVMDLSWPTARDVAAPRTSSRRP